MRTGIAHLPLHGGKAPAWLFQRMKKLAREITIIIVSDFGADEFLKRLSDPFWFQSFGCVLGFDWHSSGVTTTVGGALKEGLKGLEKDLGLAVAGGKGGTSRKTPSEIETFGEVFSFPQEKINNLVYASKMSAKVDTSVLQDGFQLYHHNFIFTRRGDWAVFQQGMNPDLKAARRYHWLSSSLKDFVEEPHTAICTEKKSTALDLTAKESKQTRELDVELVRDNFPALLQDLKRLDTLILPMSHPIYPVNFDVKRLDKILRKINEKRPEDFERMLGLSGVGPRTILALTLISELIYSTKPSWKDPARYSFAHGGKDGYPYPVQKETYDKSIEILSKAINKSKINRSEKIKALKALNQCSPF
ncbi:MAG: DUF763 domain-containing protein [candidate division Zixibacteria bacterium]|nr:DUF763 domain-containing protein [candidate division Zixibacteria bacterium]